MNNLHLLQSPLRRPSGSIATVAGNGKPGVIVSVARGLTPRSCHQCDKLSRELMVIKEQLTEKDKLIMELKGRLATAQAIADLSYHTTPSASPQLSAIKF